MIDTSLSSPLALQALSTLSTPHGALNVDLSSLRIQSTDPVISTVHSTLYKANHLFQRPIALPSQANSSTSLLTQTLSGNGTALPSNIGSLLNQASGSTLLSQTNQIPPQAQLVNGMHTPDSLVNSIYGDSNPTNNLRAVLSQQQVGNVNLASPVIGGNRIGAASDIFRSGQSQMIASNPISTSNVLSYGSPQFGSNAVQPTYNTGSSNALVNSVLAQNGAHSGIQSSTNSTTHIIFWLVSFLSLVKLILEIPPFIINGRLCYLILCRFGVNQSLQIAKIDHQTISDPSDRRYRRTASKF